MVINEFISITKALSDPQRVRAVLALQGGELCVCQITELLGLAPSTISKHMSILKQAGIIASRKEGKWVYYSLLETEKRFGVKNIIKVTLDNLRNDQTVMNDSFQLQRIKAMDLSSLCRSEHRRSNG